MKKLILVSSCMLTLVICILVFNSISLENFNKMLNIESDYSTSIYLDNIKVTDVQLYKSLEKVSKKYNVNLYKTTFDYDNLGNPILKKGILINNIDSKILKQYNIKGKKLQDIDFKSENLIISNIKNDDIKGKIKLYGIGKNDRIEIKDLKTFYKDHSQFGEYKVEIKSTDNYNEFIDNLVVDINKYNEGEQLYRDDIEGYKGNLKDIKSNITTDIYMDLMISLIFISVLFYTYYFLMQSRKVMILTLEGIDKKIILKEIVFKLILQNVKISMIVILINILITFTLNLKYIAFIIIYTALFYILVLIIGILIVKFIKSGEMTKILKNKKKSNGILAVNLVIKTIMILFIINIFTSSTNYIYLKYNDYKILKSWDNAKEYAVFKYLRIMPKDEYSDTNNAHNDIFNSIDALYSDLNSMGSLYVNPSDYINENSSDFTFPGFKTIIINPNYLDYLNLLDENGEKLRISENEKKYIILLNEKEKDNTELIRKIKTTYAFWNQSGEESYESFKNRVSDKELENAIKIIYIQDNQKVFSWNKDINPNFGNYILNPIISVKTMKNKELITVATGEGINELLKIPLLNNDVDETYNVIKEYLKENGVESNLPSLIRSNEFNSYEIQIDKQNLQGEILKLVFSIIVYISFIFQKNTIIFNSNAKKFVIKRFSGMSKIATYKAFYIELVISFLLAVTFLLKGGDVTTIKRSLIFIAVLFIIELLLTLSFILRHERKIKLKLLKGDI